jgi:oligoribonuclease NrnB/cAMP/cGMP phosphodiesterase (DHH superfamily)
MKPIVVIYHGDCPDGFGGAWAAWRKLGARADYIGAKHGSLPPEELEGREIYMIDFVYPEGITRELTRKNERVTAIDHHISAEAITKATDRYSYSLDRSGAALAWEYFHAKTKLPKLLAYVEDRDLWHFKLPKSKEICSYLEIFEHDFKAWSRLARDIESASLRKKMAEQGKLILRYEEKLVEEIVEKSAEPVEFFGIKTYAVNSQNFESQIGDVLRKKFPPMAIVWRKRGGEVRVSLRSDGSVDVAELAARLGGGGHRKAAGLAFKYNPGDAFPWKSLPDEKQ